MQQQPTPRASTLPPPQPVQVAPAAPGSATYIITTAPPTTPAELRALQRRRSELSSQIQNVSNRREEIAEQLKSADPGARAGLQERLKVIDERIVSMERELLVTGEALRGVPPSLLASASVSQGPDPGVIAGRIAGDIVPIVAILSVFVFAPMALALSRFIWKRAIAPSPARAIDEAAQRRLDQLQQAVDTIAIEVERISEGQRFVTKVLSDAGKPALSEGQRVVPKLLTDGGTPAGRPPRKTTPDKD